MDQLIPPDVFVPLMGFIDAEMKGCVDRINARIKSAGITQATAVLNMDFKDPTSPERVALSPTVALAAEIMRNEPGRTFTECIELVEQANAEFGFKHNE